MRLGVFVCALTAALTAPQLAGAADYGHKRPVYKSQADVGFDRGFSGILPSCTNERVRSRVVYGFANTERTYWGTGLTLTTIDRPVEIGFRTWGPSFIPRRFCEAKTHTSDGRRRTVVYNIQQQQGLASIGYGVEWCVVGLDRHYAYAPACKMARP